MLKKKIFVIVFVVMILILVDAAIILIMYRNKPESMVGITNCDNAGYLFWCENQDRCLNPFEDVCVENGASLTLEGVKDVFTDIVFSDFVISELDWHSEGDYETYPALMISANEVNLDVSERIENYFAEEGFLSGGLGNIMTGTLSGGQGYSKDNILCFYESDSTRYFDLYSSEERGNKFVDVSITCAVSN